MAWVEIPAPADLVLDASGNIQTNLAASIKIAGTATDVTHAADTSGGSPATGSLVVRSDGSFGTVSQRRYVQSGTPLNATVATVTRRLEPWAADAGATKANVPVNASDYQGSGVSDETALLLAADAANSAGRGLFVPRRAAEWVTSVPIPFLAAGELFGNWTVIRQSTWRKPVFDLEVTDDVDVHHFYLRSTATRTSGASSFRGDDEDRYGAGVWLAGDRCRVRHIRAEGLDSAVHATNWTTGSTHAGRRLENVIEDIRVSGTDFGVLAVAQEGAHIENIRGSVVRSTGSGDPAHLVYIIGYGSDLPRDITGGNWRAYDSAADPAFQLRGIEGGAFGAIMARNCGGLLNYEALKDVTIDRLVGLDDQRADESGSILAIDGTSARLRIKTAIVRKAVSGRAAYLYGIDCVIDDLVVEANRTAQNFNADVKLEGTRSRIERLRHTNAGSSTTGAEAVEVIGTAVDCAVLNPEIRNAEGTPCCNNGIVIRSSATRTRVDYDPDMIVPNASFVKVSDSGTNSRISIARRDGKVQSLNTDANFTLTPGTSPEQTIHTGTLTAGRTATLSSTGAVAGMKFRVARTGGGAFNLTVGSKALATNQWSEHTFDGSNWGLTAFGSL